MRFQAKITTTTDAFNSRLEGSNPDWSNLSTLSSVATDLKKLEDLSKAAKLIQRMESVGGSTTIANWIQPAVRPPTPRHTGGIGLMRYPRY